MEISCCRRACHADWSACIPVFVSIIKLNYSVYSDNGCVILKKKNKAWRRTNGSQFVLRSRCIHLNDSDPAAPRHLVRSFNTARSPASAKQTRDLSCNLYFCSTRSFFQPERSKTQCAVNIQMLPCCCDASRPQSCLRAAHGVSSVAADTSRPRRSLSLAVVSCYFLLVGGGEGKKT